MHDDKYILLLEDIAKTIRTCFSRQHPKSTCKSNKKIKESNWINHVEKIQLSYNFRFRDSLIGFGMLLLNDFFELLFVPIFRGLIIFTNIAVKASLLCLTLNLKVVRELAAVSFSTGTCKRNLKIFSVINMLDSCILTMNNLVWRKHRGLI